MKKQSIFKRFEGFLFLIPFLVPYLVFVFGMLVFAIGLSFTDYSIVKETNFVALKNYSNMFKDPVYWDGLKHTLQYVLFSTPFYMLLAYFFALMLDARRLRLKNLFRSLFYLPIVLPVSIVALTSTFMYQPYVGLYNNMLRSFGLLGPNDEILWLGKELAWITITIITAWWGSGFNIILYLAGLQDIPETYYESAEIDGATYWQRTMYITTPLLSRIHVTVLFFILIGSFKIFGQIYWVTGGGPSGATRAYVQYLWEVGFMRFDYGGASAVSVIFLFLVFVVSGLQYTISSKYTGIGEG